MDVSHISPRRKKVGVNFVFQGSQRYMSKGLKEIMQHGVHPNSVLVMDSLVSMIYLVIELRNFRFFSTVDF